MGGSAAIAGAKRGLPVLQGIRPFDRARLGPDVVAGVTLAALANANRLIEEVRAIAAGDTAVETVCIAMGAVGDVDYTGGEALRGLFHELGGNAVYETVQDVVDERTSTGGDRG